MLPSWADNNVHSPHASGLHHWCITLGSRKDKILSVLKIMRYSPIHSLPADSLSGVPIYIVHSGLLVFTNCKIMHATKQRHAHKGPRVVSGKT